MVLEHEIPQGAKLYFGKSAKTKREIEALCAEILQQYGYEEIATPLFSYGNDTYESEKEILKISNEKNHQIILRGDSTFEVVHIVNKRIGKSTEHQKWFYIQPVYAYPTTETHQIGAENLGSGDILDSLQVASKIFNSLQISPVLQISDFAIPKKVGEISHLSLDDLKEGNLYKIIQNQEEWLKALLSIQSIEDLKQNLPLMPQEIQIELKKLQDIVCGIDYPNIIIAPLYYSPMKYYKGEFFKFFDKNTTFALGGNYSCEGSDSSGFAIYTDNILETILK